MVATLMASVVERVERVGKHVIDDNVTVPLSSLVTMSILAKLLSSAF